MIGGGWAELVLEKREQLFGLKKQQHGYGYRAPMGTPEVSGQTTECVGTSRCVFISTYIPLTHLKARSCSELSWGAASVFLAESDLTRT